MPGKVIDASVLGALIFREPRMDEAASLIRGADLYAPTLLAYELTRIALKKALHYQEARDFLERALEVGLGMDIQWVEVPHVATLRLALATGLTTYDASYLYVADTLNATLVTFDQQLHAAGRHIGP